MRTPDNQLPSDGDGDSLDQLLKHAAWPEPEPAAEERLSRHWESVSARRKKPQLVWWISAVAACLLVGVAAWWLAGGMQRRSNSPQQPVQTTEKYITHKVPIPPNTTTVNQDGDAVVEKNGTTIPPERIAPDKTVASENPIVADGTMSASRPPTDYELIVLTMLESRKHVQADGEQEKLLQEALDTLTAQPDADPRALAASMPADSGFFERRLLQIIERSDIERQLAGIRLLGVIGSRQCVPRLIELARHDRTHSAAIRALANVADPQTVGQLIEQETSAELQAHLLSALLARNGSEPVALFLRFVQSPQTSEVALSAVDNVSRPPAETLFQFLGSSLQAERFAAARVLGRLGDPAVMSRLAKIAADRTHQQEALVALLTSPHEAAAGLLGEMSRDVVLASAVESVRLQLQFSTPLLTRETVP